MTHTPTPYYVVGPPWGDGTYIVAGNPDPHAGRFVADFAPDLEEWEEDERDVLADAEFVCRAANAHDDLMKVAHLIADYCFTEVGSWQAGDPIGKVYKAAVAAIVKGDGKA